nr:hypothetical protein [Halomonas elongata]
MVSREIRLASLNTPLRVSVAAPRNTIDLEASRFNRLLGFSLAGLGLLILLGLAVQIRWGLAPCVVCATISEPWRTATPSGSVPGYPPNWAGWPAP